MPSLGFSLAGPLGAGAGVGQTPVDELNNIGKLLTAFGVAVQDLEKAGQQVLTQRTLDTAIGAQLDDIGLIVGQPRNGISDNLYRLYCRAAIVAHRSKSTLPDVIRVMTLVLQDATIFHVFPQDVATVVVRVDGGAIASNVAGVTYSFIRRTVATGVRALLEYSTVAPAARFRFNTGPGFNQGALIARLDVEGET